MTYLNAVDERYAGSFDKPIGYYDASNLLNEVFVTAENDLAYEAWLISKKRKNVLSPVLSRTQKVNFLIKLCGKGQL